LWPVLLDSREDREKHRDVAVVVGVAVDGDEVGDAVLGCERGVMALELPVRVREPVERDYLSEVAPLTDQARREFRRERVPVAAVKDLERASRTFDRAYFPVDPPGVLAVVDRHRVGAVIGELRAAELLIIDDPSCWHERRARDG
jgi:hypothetical protein